MNQPSQASWPRRKWLGESASLLLVLFLIVPVTVWAAFLNARTMAIGWQVVIGVALVMGLLALAVRYRRLLFSPVLMFEVLRLARNRRVVIGRCLYGLVILVVLFLAYAARFGLRDCLGAGQKLSHAARAEFAREFFYAFLAVQLLAVVLLLPLRTASAIAGEKEKRCLEFILTTELSSTEIVLGKLLAVLAGMGMLLLTGLPVLGFVQLLGGVEPRLLLGGFLVTLATMVSLGSMGMLVSVYNHTSWDAAFRTYLWALLSGVALSPIFALISLEEFLRRQNSSSFLGVLAIYTVMHCLMAGVCCFLAIARFRWLAMQQAGELPSTGPAAKDPLRRPPARPPIGNYPLWWKENHDADGVALHQGFWAVTPIVCVLLIAIVGANQAESSWKPVCHVVTFWECLAFFILAMTAARRFSLEMEQQTLDSLLALPERDKVFAMKWWASVLYLRWLFAAGYIAGVVGVVRGLLDPRGFLLITLAWPIYAAFLSSLALWISLVTGSTLKARTWTILTLLLVMGTIYLLADNAAGLLKNWKARSVAASVRDRGAMPPATLWHLASGKEARTKLIADPNGKGWVEKPITTDELTLMKLSGPLIGLAIYALLAWLFWAMARQRFRGLVGKKPRLHAFHHHGHGIAAAQAK